MEIARKLGKANRRCLQCGFEGTMKTWLANYSFPQFLAIVLLCAAFLPGVIFIGWAWGKYKCPKCGALAKNTYISPNAEEEWSHLEERTCPFCAEVIKEEAIVCKHCGRDLPKQAE